MPHSPAPKGRGSHIDPPNRFHSLHLVDDPEHPPEEDAAGRPGLQTQYVLERARTIVAENDSPDVPFRYSINAYRGCEHGCSYCLAGDTPILMADGTTSRLEDLRVGDSIYGTVRRGWFRRYVKTCVLAHWGVTRPAYRVQLRDGTSLIAGEDHRFLTERGWKFVAPQPGRAYLTTNNKLMGTGGFAQAPQQDPEYKRGYLCGMLRSDALLGSYVYDGRRRAHDTQYQFRLALADDEALLRSARYLLDFGAPTHAFRFQEATATRSRMNGIRTNARENVERVAGLIAWPEDPSLGWRKGFLAGVFDAEGSYSDGILRISNTDPFLVDAYCRCLLALGFSYALERKDKGRTRPLWAVRLRGGLTEHLRFFHAVATAISRKRDIQGQAVKSSADLRVAAVEPLGLDIPLFDITTGTGDFIANGVISHNCYARPTHEYLGLNAGLDFETKIFVKENAPALFRDFLARDRWVPEVIALSGVTDCYQPCERKFRLTRGCLEVAWEARQPMTLITKNALVLRDLDLLKDMAAEGLVHVSLSVTTLDAELARSMEPRTSTPQARLRAVQTLAGAGVPVRVLIAPVIPGLNDSEIPAILAAAREAGAWAARYILLRLPLTVAPVFRDWLEREQPGRLARIEGRIRDARGGKLNNAEFGQRMCGTGEMAEQTGKLFRLFARRHKLDGELPPCDCARFRPPLPRSGQLRFF
jgi:DNA repair photolyase